MPKEFSRTERLAELLQRELALLIQQEIKDPRLGMVTVNHVDISRDLAFAKAYVTILADEAGLRESLNILNKAAGFLRKQLGQRIKVRTIPALNFIYDKTIVEGNRLSRLIDEAIASDEHKHSSEQ